jgi:hypothetical protein
MFSADRLTGDQSKPDFDLVDPRRSDRYVMDSDVRIVGQPVPYFGGEVRPRLSTTA